MNKNEIIELLKQIKYPGFSRDIVSFGLIKEIQIENQNLIIQIQLTTGNPDHQTKLESEIKDVIQKNIASINELKIEFIGTASPEKKVENMQAAKPENLSGVKNIIAIASGKGGVGKSTIAINIAAELSKNYKVGILDLDIYGPSLPMVAGINETPKITAEKKLIPIEKYNMKFMSFGFVSGNDAPTIWRGPLVSRMTQQFFDDVNWGELDFLILDLPPGTGDIQLTLVQKIALTGAIIVTTPQDLAVLDVKKGADMFKKVNTPLLGIIENMSHFECPHCHKPSEIFKGKGGESESKRLDIPLLGSVPLSPELVKSADSGDIFVLNNIDSVITNEFEKMTKQIITNSILS
ncbi:MAG: Mrp/NBP35 family ATP-binding protein [Candidatus Marinimicrobia bacterium]|nr:Mrp/NBP35 family ATP-binding protein [Candidatus Neomarinimicrobiota bacterium]